MYFCIMYFYIIGAKIHLLLNFRTFLAKKEVISVGFDQKSPLFTSLSAFLGAKQKNHGALTMVTHRTLADVRMDKWLSKIYLVYFLMRLPN